MKNFETLPFADVFIKLDIEFGPVAGDVLQLLDVATKIAEGLPPGLQRKKMERRIRVLIRRFERHVNVVEQEEEDEDQGDDHRSTGDGCGAGHPDDE